MQQCVRLFYTKKQEDRKKCIFKNEKHKESFREGLRKVNKNDRDAVSTVYLLSADSCLWRRANQGDGKKKQYRIHHARKKRCSAATFSANTADRKCMEKNRIKKRMLNDSF